DQKLLQAAQRAVLKDAHFVVLVFSKPHDLLIFNRLAAFILAQPLARKNSHIDDRAFDTGRDSYRSVAHFTTLLTEDSSQQFLFRRKLSLAFRRDFTDQNIARFHLGANANDAALIEVHQSFVAHVGNVAGDLLRAKLGVARDAFEFFDVD